MGIDFLLQFIEGFADKVIPLRSEEGSKVPAVKGWNLETFNDSPYRNKDWILKGNNFGIKWKKGIVVLDTDNEEQSNYLSFYLHFINANYYTIKTPRGMHFVLSGDDIFFKNSSEVSSFMLFKFGIRNHNGQSVIKMSGDDTHRRITASSSKVKFSKSTLSNIKNVPAFNSVYFNQIQDQSIKRMCITDFTEGNIIDQIYQWKKFALAIDLEFEDFKYAAEVLKKYLMEEKKYIALDSYADWDNQVEGYAKEWEKYNERREEDHTEEKTEEKPGIRLSREIQELIDNGAITKHQDENSITLILVEKDLFIKQFTIEELARELIDRGLFRWMSAFNRFASVVKVLKGSTFGGGIDFNNPLYHRYILFNNGYLDTLGIHAFYLGRPDSYCAFKINATINLSTDSYIFNDVFSALTEKFDGDEVLTAAFFKNLLDVNGRDGFGIFLKGPGDSGKTQFVEFLANTVLTSKLAMSISLKQLLDRPLPKWHDKMLLYANEINEKMTFGDTSNIKAMITRDSYSSRKLYSDEVNLKSKATLIFISNMEVNTAGIVADNSMERRIFFYEWTSPLFKEVPFWYKKGYSMTEKERNDFFSSWVKMFVEQKQITRYQIYIKDSKFNHFKKSLIENNSVYQFMQELFNDIGWYFADTGQSKFPNDVAVECASSILTIQIKKTFFGMKYTEFCKENNYGRKNVRNVNQDLVNARGVNYGESRIIFNRIREYSYKFIISWDEKKGFTFSL